jgi:hypothetical protein
VNVVLDGLTNILSTAEKLGESDKVSSYQICGFGMFIPDLGSAKKQNSGKNCPFL